MPSGSPRIGIQLPEVERDVRWPEYRAMARAAEEVGFDSIWLGDHLLYREEGKPERGPWEVWTHAGRACRGHRAGRARPARGMHRVPPAGPDREDGGDARRGVRAGASCSASEPGWNEPEFRAFGLPYDHRVSRFEEAFTIIRGLLAGERVTLDGRFFKAEDLALLPHPDARPRLVIGSNGPAHARRDAAACGGLEHLVRLLRQLGRWLREAERGDHRARRATPAANPARSSAAHACWWLWTTRPASGGGARTWSRSPARPIGSSRPCASSHEAGADEIIVVADPITERSIRELGDAIGLLRA